MDESFIRIRHILASIEKIEKMLAENSETDFFDDFRVYNVIIRELEIIGEASGKVSGDFQKQFPEIPWREISDFRNVLIHEYFGVNLDIVWKVAQDRLPELKKNISKILSSFSQK